jgi:hypothetical protein
MARWLPASLALACHAAPDTLETAQRADALAVSESPIGTEPPVPLQYRTGSYLSLASGESTELVVFYDGGLIRGMRFDQAGTRLDLDGWLRLGRDGGASTSAAYTDLAYGAGTYLVVYADYGETSPGLYAQVVAESGELLSEPALVQPDGIYGAAVWNGTDFTVAAYSGDIHLSRVGLDGVPVAGSSTPVTTSGVNNRPSLAMGANGVGVVAFEQATDGANRKLYASRFSADGEVLDPGGVLISDATTSSVDVSVAAGTEGFLAVWSAGGSTVYGSVIDEAGTVLVQEAPLSRNTSDIGGSSVAFDGTNYLVAWEDGRTGSDMIYGTRVSEAGVPLDSSDVELAGPSRAYQSWELDLAWTGDAFALTYASDGIYGGFFASDLSPVGALDIELTAIPSAQGVPVAAWDGTNYVLGYSDERDSENLAYSFRSVRIGTDGAIVDPEGVAISEPELPASGGSVASNGVVTLYTFQPMFEEELYQRVRSADGTLSAATVWGTGTGGMVASNGEGFLAAFATGDDGSGNDAEVWVQGFDATGNVAGDPTLLVNVTRPRGLLSAFGSDYLYAYSGQEDVGTVIPGSALLVDASGTVAQEYGPVVDGMLTATTGASEEQLLISWQDDAEALWGRLLHKEDGFGDPFPLVPGIAEGPPAVAWDGTKFVVAYADDRMAMWTLEVSVDGTTSTPERLFDGDYGWPSLTAGPDGQMLLTYLHWHELSRTRRVESRFVGANVDIVPPVEEPPAEEPPVEEPPSEEPPSDEPVSEPEAELPEPSAPPVDLVDDPSVPVSTPEASEADQEPDEEDPDSDEADDVDAPVTSDSADETALEMASAPSSNDGSCSVAVVGRAGSAGLAWLLLGGLGSLVRKRRRD